MSQEILVLTISIIPVIGVGTYLLWKDYKKMKELHMARQNLINYLKKGKPEIN